MDKDQFDKAVNAYASSNFDKEEAKHVENAVKSQGMNYLLPWDIAMHENLELSERNVPKVAEIMREWYNNHGRTEE